MARILILRAASAAEGTIAMLRAAGHEALALPVDEILPLDPAPPELDAIDAAIVTSRNAVPWTKRHLPRTTPMVAVGDATAHALRVAGFDSVTAGNGAAGPDLLVLCGDARVILYAAGRVRTDALERAATARGLRLVVAEVYDTRALSPSRDEIASAIGDRPADAALVLSAGQAAGLSRLRRAAPELVEATRNILCISQRVAAALDAPFRDRAIVADGAELMRRLDRL